MTMTLEEFHSRLLEAHPKCSYRLYLDGMLRWTPAYTSRLMMFKDFPEIPPHREPAKKVQEASFVLYFNWDFFDRASREVKYEAVNLDALLLNVTVGSLADAWNGNKVSP